MDLTLRHGLLFTDSFFETDSSWPYSSRSQTKAPCCSPYTRQCQGGIGPVCIVEPHNGAARDDDAPNDAARCLRHYSICTPPMHTPARLPRPLSPLCTDNHVKSTTFACLDQQCPCELCETLCNNDTTIPYIVARVLGHPTLGQLLLLICWLRARHRYTRCNTSSVMTSFQEKRVQGGVDSSIVLQSKRPK